MRVELQSTNPEIWQTQDEQWMASRIEEWRNVQHRLREPRLQIKRAQMQQLKSYFFTGAHCPVVEKMVFGAGIDDFYVWWLHPIEPKEFVYSEYESGNLNGTREVFVNMYSAVAKRAKEFNGDTYGVMGGRELSLMRALNPGMEWRKPHDLGGGKGSKIPRNRGGECMRPSSIMNHCIGDTSLEIESENYLAFRPGIVLWDHFNYAIEHDEMRTWMSHEHVIEDETLHNEPFVLKNKARTYKVTKALLKDLLNFFDRDPSDAALQRPRTVALVEELVGRYERRDFCDNLLWHWDAAKSDL